MRSWHSRPLDSDKLLQWLTKRHENLKAKVHELDKRSYLTPQEHLRYQELKKKKLAIKDELYNARRDVASQPSDSF